MKNRSNKKGNKDKRIMKNNVVTNENRSSRNAMDASYALLDLEENHLVGRISENLFQLEQNVEFFSFVIKEIEEITKQ